MLSTSMDSMFAWSRRLAVGRGGGRRSLRVLGALFIAAGLAGCASQTQKEGLFGAAGEAGARVANVRPGTLGDFSHNVGNKVLFLTDSAELTPQARAVLDGQARWLKQYSNYRVTIEGHADERGTREYNLGLAARRAAAVKRYLVSKGIDSARLRTISYGKERPVATCDNISCWSQNRRAVTALSGTG